MYLSVYQALQEVYRIRGVRMEPLNNTAAVCGWLESKGVTRGRSELSQSEHHANAAMIISRIERVLNRYELAAVECRYSEDLSGIVDLTAYIEKQNKGVNLLLCDALLLNLFRGLPRMADIADKYGLPKRTAFRQRAKIDRILFELEDAAHIKLYDEFKRCGILS